MEPLQWPFRYRLPTGAKPVPLQSLLLFLVFVSTDLKKETAKSVQLVRTGLYCVRLDPCEGFNRSQVE